MTGGGNVFSGTRAERREMPLIGGSTDKAGSAASRREAFALACQLYRDGAPAASCELFAAHEREERDCVAAKTNLALCRIAAGDDHGALDLLDRALSLVKSTNAARGTPRDEMYIRLRALQSEGKSHLAPMPLELPDALPRHAEERILRLLLDLCVRLDLRERAQNIRASLNAF